ncbi:uncharacterized protein LAESUDRAFT_814251 [Laetiporus sulphureus 93-53]|uniref:Uncharacterized protein n=1 Tax=Laetiporus sulphureus 93-53 TaxID=1314785 RepID=A0A165D5X2_9APHY|nr:uncharacterized protein LAESUDRAFT_814251 [Laetiporus sulphureus 93-53]KZT04208.1 hypothetical protein LAESUDRAFT_814251 [Laetiporus sulphureus 93-53]
MTKVCKANKACREAFKAHVLPPDFDRNASTSDRSTALESHADILGRSIRLMACMHHSTLKEAIGELLFLACNSNAQELSALIGYGNAAGFNLYNHNMLAAPPTTSSSQPSSSSGPATNPITGTLQTERENPAEEMTQEEKEREVEKLTVQQKSSSF